jgi:predicted RNase H-like nuclease
MTGWPPQAPVAGVDGCPAGWLAVIVDAAGPGAARAQIVADSASLRDLPAGSVAVDMPIGLRDVPAPGGRAADRAARAFLARHAPAGMASGSRVFATPTRAHLDRLHLGFAGCNAGFPPGQGQRLSAQAFNIAAKIAALDLALDPRGPVREAHPEVSFAALIGRTLAPKKTPDGRAARRDALTGLGFELDAFAASLGRCSGRWGRDDLYDACILCWTAARIAAGAHTTLPDPPERDRAGHRMAIHY